MTETLAYLSTFVAIAGLGHLIHLVKKLVDHRNAGDRIGLPAFIKTRPYRTLLGACGSVAAVLVLYELDQLTIASALGAGYMADSGLSLLERSTARRV